MTVNRKIVQLSLISIGLFLILATYFLYPKINKDKLEKVYVRDNTPNIKEPDSKEEESNLFENIEYNGIYNANNPFTVKSEKAYISTNDPDIVYMTKVKTTLYINDGRIVTITSDKGKYNKVTYDSYFVGNVRAADGESIMSSENLDLLATQSAIVYNNVVLTSDKGLLRADKIKYNFETRSYHISMFKDKKVKIKLIK